MNEHFDLVLELEGLLSDQISTHGDLAATAAAVIAAGWRPPRVNETVESSEEMRVRHGVSEDAVLVMDSDGARFEQTVGQETVVVRVAPLSKGEEQ